LFGAFVAVVLAACAAYAPVPVEPAANLDAACARHLDASSQKALRIDPAASLATIRVYRGGALSRFGHDHVVASRDVYGYVDLQEGKTLMCVPLDRLTVDEPALRAEAGFDTQPTPDAVEATRHNMLGKVLDTGQFPVVLIRGLRKDGEASTFSVSMTLRGVTRVIEMPVQLDAAPGRVTATGSFSLNQTDFGIVPMSILGGAIVVQDRLDVRFRIVAGSN